VAECRLVALAFAAAVVGFALPVVGRTLDAAGAIEITLAILVATTGLGVDLANLAQLRPLAGRLALTVILSSALLALAGFGLSEAAPRPAAGALVAIGLAPSEVASVGLAGLAGGDVAVGAALLAGSALVTIVGAGPALALLVSPAAPPIHSAEARAATNHLGTRADHIAAGELVFTLVLVVALPLFVGGLSRAILAGPGVRQPVFDAGRLASVLALLALLFEVAAEVRLTSGEASVAGLIVVFLGLSGGLGWILGRGLPRPTGTAVGLATGMRDFAVAAGIAAAAFGPAVAGPCGIYGLFVLVFGALVAARAGRRTPPGSR
jgi:predicted Na+-dependent transporter